MSLMRAFLLRHRAFALALAVAALCLKVLVPAGYMLSQGPATLTVRICADASGHAEIRQIALPAGGETGAAQDKQTKDLCPFSSLAMAKMAEADSALLALALVFILAIGLAAATPPRPGRAPRLRPPLRGPPLPA